MPYPYQLNNLAAAAVEEGNLSISAELFKEALDATLAKMTGNGSAMQNKQPINRHQRERLNGAAAILSRSFPRGDRKTASNPRNMSCSGAFIYRRAFMIDSDDAQDFYKTNPKTSEHVSPACTMASATLLFNLGLTYHLKGEATSARSSQTFEHAAGFYEMALELIQCVFDAADNHTVNSRLVIAILNNLGEIYYERGEYQRSKKCFSSLSTILISMAMSGSHNCVDSGDWAGFLMNTMVIHDLKAAPAA